MRRKSKPPSRSAKLSPRSAVDADIEMGRRIRLRRREKGISQRELAGHLGLTFQQLQKYEKGTNRVGAARRGSSKSLRCSASKCRFSTMVTARNQTSKACSSSTAFSASECARLHRHQKSIGADTACKFGRDHCGFSALIASLRDFGVLGENISVTWPLATGPGTSAPKAEAN
jgi:hypothetical protein